MAIIQWNSRRGGASKKNCDAGGAIVTDKFVFAIIADAAEGKGSAPAEFIAEWTKDVLDRLTKIEEINQQVVIEKMRDAHAQLRTRYILERACYAALLLDQAASTGVAYSCGDCRVGRQSDGHPPKWISVVHSKANWSGEQFQPRHAEMPERHFVTRTLNAKRFDHPDAIAIEHNPNTSWVLATDGYWLEHQMLEVPQESLIDDSSILHISPGVSQLHINSDCRNWYLPA